MVSRNAEILVLHVDDEPDFGDMAAEFIERQDERINVKIARSASEGLDRLSENSFDCIVSDYDMPKQNGIEFLEAVRENFPELPFILYTGKGSEEVASDAIHAGVTDYLQKESGLSQYEVLANRILNVVEQQRARHEVSKTEERLRTIAENTNDILWKFNRDWSELLFINSAYEEIWGRSVEELRAEPTSFLEGIHPKDRDFVRDAMERLSAGESVDIEYRVNADEDFGRWVWVQGEPVFDNDGEVEKVVGFARDITARKQQAERYEALIEHSMDVTTVIDDTGTIIYESPSLKRILGYEPEQLIGETAFEYIHPEDRDRIVALFSGLMDQPGPAIERVTYRFEHADGHWVWLETVGRINPDSPIEGYVLNSRDVTEQKEQERELERYRAITQQANSTIITIDESSTIQSVNPAVEETFGYEPEELVGEKLTVLMSEVTADQHRDALQRYLDTDDKTVNWNSVEVTGLHRNGTAIPLLVSFGEATFEGDRFFVGIIRDITERKRQAESFNALFQNSVDAIVFTEFVDGVPIVRDVNPAFEETFGYDKEDAIGRSVDELVVADDPDIQQEAEALNRRIESGERVVAEVRRQTPDGVKDFLLQSTPLSPEETNEFTYAIYTDITRRKSYELALEGLHDASERLLQADSKDRVCQAVVEIAERVLEHPYGSVFLWNDATEKLEAIANSQEALDTFGEPPSFERGEGIIGHVFETGQRLVLDDAQEDPRALESGSGSIRAYAVFPLGEHGVLVFGSPEVGSLDGQELQLASTLARHTRVALDQITRQNTLLQREEVLERQNERLDEFVSVVSHDLRNPLSVAQGRIELASNEWESEHVDAIERAHDRMEELIDDLLSLARAGEELGETGPVALADVVDACWNQVTTGDAELSVQTEATIEADENRLKQLLENLLRNPVEHTDSGVTITIGDLPGGFYVEDDGPGIPEDERENVLQPGYTTSEDGTGYGLSIVRNIAEAHGWSITVTPGSTGGTRFEFTGVQTT